VRIFKGDPDPLSPFLNAAGFSLSANDTFDLVIQFCLEKKINDVCVINEALDNFSQKPSFEVLE